jgi:peptidoglycan hydrolase-like protein with peptidoglycan-binding domain
VHKAILSGLAVAALACSSVAATPAKSKKKHHPATTASSTSAHTHARPAVASKAAAAKGSRTARVAHRKGSVSRRTTRYYQQAPTPERYREIQQALASKGYFHGEPSGEWGPDSADALKRFQADQSLMPDGKINSLSLIALGLGPKHLTAAKSDAVPQAAPPATLPAPATPATPASPPQ